jgi:multidrug efflux pump subunit AcrA (membrane-fusion protein)
MRVFRVQYLRRMRGSDPVDIAIPARFGAGFWPLVIGSVFAIVAATVWSVRAELPMVVKSDAVLLPLGGMRDIVAISDGIVETRLREAGDTISPGNLLVHISDVGLEKQYREERATYLSTIAALRARETAERVDFERRRDALITQEQRLSAQITRLEGEIDRTEQLLSMLRTRTDQTVLDSEQIGERIGSLNAQVSKAIEALNDRNLIAQLDFIDRAVTLSNRGRDLTESRLRTAGFLFDLAERDDEQARRKQELAELRDQREAIELERAAERAAYDSQIARVAQEAETAEQTLINFERRTWLAQNVLSPYSGRVVALAVSSGQFLSSGSPVALVELAPQLENMTIILSPRLASARLQFEHAGSKQQYGIAITPATTPQAVASAVAAMIEALLPELRAEVEVRNALITIHADPGSRGSLSALRMIDIDARDAQDVPVFVTPIRFDGDFRAQKWSAVSVLRPRHARQSLPGQRAKVRPRVENQIFGAAYEGQVSEVSAFNANVFDVTQAIGSKLLAERFLADGQQGVLTIIDLDEHPDLVGGGIEAGQAAQLYVEIGKDAPYRILLPFLTRILTGRLDEL